MADIGEKSAGFRALLPGFRLSLIFLMRKGKLKIKENLEIPITEDKH